MKKIFTSPSDYYFLVLILNIFVLLIFCIFQNTLLDQQRKYTTDSVNNLSIVLIKNNNW